MVAVFLVWCGAGGCDLRKRKKFSRCSSMGHVACSFPQEVVLDVNCEISDTHIMYMVYGLVHDIYNNYSPHWFPLNHSKSCSWTFSKNNGYPPKKILPSCPSFLQYLPYLVRRPIIKRSWALFCVRRSADFWLITHWVFAERRAKGVSPYQFLTLVLRSARHPVHQTLSRIRDWSNFGGVMWNCRIDLYR